MKTICTSIEKCLRFGRYLFFTLWRFSSPPVCKNDLHIFIALQRRVFVIIWNTAENFGESTGSQVVILLFKFLSRGCAHPVTVLKGRGYGLLELISFMYLLRVALLFQEWVLLMCMRLECQSSISSSGSPWQRWHANQKWFMILFLQGPILANFFLAWPWYLYWSARHPSHVPTMQILL